MFSTDKKPTYSKSLEDTIIKEQTYYQVFKKDPAVYEKTAKEYDFLIKAKKEINKFLFKKFGTKRPGNKQFTNILKFTV